MNNNKPIPYCPSCDHEITEFEINISEGVALCNSCGSLNQLSSLNYLSEPVEELLSKKDKRIKISSDREHIKIHISLFSIWKLLGSTFITLFWNGIVSLFVSLAIAAVSFNTIGYVPDWLPVPGLVDGKPVMNDQVMGVGITVFFCLFLTPFIIIGSVLIIQTLLFLLGSTVIMIDKEKSYVSTGIGFFRFRKSFDPNQIRSIQHSIKKSDDSANSYAIEMTTKSLKKIKFGGSLSKKQQSWIIAMLKQLLVHKKSSKLLKGIPHLYWLK